MSSATVYIYKNNVHIRTGKLNTNGCGTFYNLAPNNYYKMISQYVISGAGCSGGQFLGYGSNAYLRSGAYSYNSRITAYYYGNCG